jgi:hypothetical protein
MNFDAPIQKKLKIYKKKVAKELDRPYYYNTAGLSCEWMAHQD